MHLIGWLSLPRLVVFFLELWSVLPFGPFFFLSWHAYSVKGRSLRCSPGRGNASCCTVMLYMGEGPRGSNGACSTLCRISVTPSAIHNQIGPLWCWFPSGWACAHSRPLWVSPMTSPVRLGVSPAAAPVPTGVFTQRFEALFPCARALGSVVCFAPRRSSGLSMRECGAVGCSLPLCLPRSPPFWVQPSRFICARMWGHRVC